MNASSSSDSHTTPSAADARERALVLGGGGSTGNAWLIGVVAGLADAGLDVTEADLVVGTSAGATAAAQITGAPPAQLFADILSAPAPQRRGPMGPGGRAPTGAVAGLMQRTGELIAASADAADMRRRMGAAALAADGAEDEAAWAQWRAIVAARLPRQDWPDTPLALTAVDARTGEPVVFDRDSGVDLADAVAAELLARPALRDRRRPLPRRRLPPQRERRPRGRVRAGAGAVALRRPLAPPGGVGHAAERAGRRAARGRQPGRDDRARPPTRSTCSA